MSQQLAVGFVCFVVAPEAAVTWLWCAQEKTKTLWSMCLCIGGKQILRLGCE